MECGDASVEDCGRDYDAPDDDHVQGDENSGGGANDERKQDDYERVSGGVVEDEDGGRDGQLHVDVKHGGD